MHFGSIRFDNFSQCEPPLESREEYKHSQAGSEYSFIGMRIKLTRNNLGLLVGGYFGPTTIFSILSLVSFTINPDIVSYFHFQSLNGRKVLKNPQLCVWPFMFILKLQFS